MVQKRMISTIFWYPNPCPKMGLWWNLYENPVSSIHVKLDQQKYRRRVKENILWEGNYPTRFCVSNLIWSNLRFSEWPEYYLDDKNLGPWCRLSFCRRHDEPHVVPGQADIIYILSYGVDPVLSVSTPESALQQLQTRNWNWLWSHSEKKRWQHRQAGAMVDTRPQRTRAIQEHLKKGSRARNADSGRQIQLLEDGGGSCIRQSWMESSSL